MQTTFLVLVQCDREQKKASQQEQNPMLQFFLKKLLMQQRNRHWIKSNLLKNEINQPNLQSGTETLNQQAKYQQYEKLKKYIVGLKKEEVLKDREPNQGGKLMSGKKFQKI